MTRNALKIIACISMLIDHIGYFIFPQISLLRYIGRISMPIFAFFIGEGCLYTRNRKKYFTRLFVLALFCQAFTVGEWLITRTGNPLYLNILFTFSASIILCSAFIKSVEAKEKKEKLLYSHLLGGLLILFFALDMLYEKNVIFLNFDYGLSGILLPLFSATTKDRKKKLLIFSAGLVLCVIAIGYSDPLWTVCSFISLVPLALYNGKSGKLNLQKAFYVFYPAHLGAIFLVSLFM